MRILRHLWLPLLLAACTREGPERVIERRTSDAPAPRGAVLLRATMLDGHNRARATLALPPLAWDDALAGSAARYAAVLAASDVFRHADQPQGPGREGENLWTGTREAYRYDEMIGHWLAERRDFVNGVTPAFSRTGRWEDVSHYSQIVWRATTRVGCATASSQRNDYLVCRYSPPGNVVGQRAY